MAVIALDLGGTKLAAALFSDEGDIIFSQVVSVEGRKGDDVGQLILQQANSLLEIPGITVSALGICVPGIAYSKSGMVWAPNIEGWENYPLRNELEHGLNRKAIRVCIDNDRACYILGEVWKGNARGCSDAIFLSVGTGIGAGIMTNNSILRGSHDIAGAIGWMGLDKPYKDKYKGCGSFEYNSSGAGLVKVATDMLANSKYTDSFLAGKNGFTAKDIFNAYEINDELAVMVVRNAVEYWGMAVANLVSLFNPEKIIFGGGVFGPALNLLNEIYLEALKWGQPISIRQVKLEASALGNDAGLYGAGYLALNE